ncbi:hypothetical protein GCM10027256_18850 [Novispirillum itersonii subsp. nipponicum]
MTAVTQTETPPLSTPRPARGGLKSEAPAGADWRVERPRDHSRVSQADGRPRPASEGLKKRSTQIAVLRLWHAVLAGGFVVAWATGDENTYALHQFSGYVVLAALMVRGLIAAFSPADSLLGWPKLSRAQVWDWLAIRRGRNPLFAGLALALLATVAATAASGAIADWVTWMEHPHEAASDITLAVIFAHIAFVFYQYGGRPWVLTQIRRIRASLWGMK